MSESIFVDPVRAPYFAPVFIPTLPSLHLSDDERALISKLQMRGWRQRYWMELTDTYYRGMQVIQDLGIAIPPELNSNLRTIVGWPRIAVDPYVERLAVDCFRLPGETEADQDLADLWAENGMDAELPLAITDALAMSRGWFTVGSPDEPGDAAEICVESPLNISAAWDVRTAEPKEVLQSYWLDDRRHAALYLPNQTIHIGEDDDGIWQIVDRDVHNFGRCPVIRMANMPRSDNRDGVSSITPELMSIVDGACRTLLGLEVAREFYSVPQKYILGATEADFQNPDGTPKSAWATYISHVLAIESDDQGNQPTVGQFKAYDPSAFTKVMEMYAAQAAGILAAEPQDLGLYTQGNPVSADAKQVSESRRDRRSGRMGAVFGVSLKKTVQMAVRFMNNGDLPDKFRRIAVDWVDPRIPNFSAAADGVSKLVNEGVWVAWSDVTLKKSGLNAVERMQMQKDREKDQAQQVLQEIGSEVEAKLIRTATSLEKEGAPAPVPGVPAAPAAP